MNDHLKRFIGSYVTASVTLSIDGKTYTEYVQGILKDVDENYTIEQYFSFSDLILGKKDLQSVVRILNPKNTSVSINQ